MQLGVMSTQDNCSLGEYHSILDLWQVGVGFVSFLLDVGGIGDRFDVGIVM